MKKAKIVVDYVLFASLVIVAISLVFELYLYLFHENPALVINNATQLQTNKLKYRAGEDIYVTFDYCRYTTAPATRYVQFVDSLMFNYPPITIPGLGVGCHVVSGNVATVPASLPVGRYYILGKHELQVNFLARRIVEWRTVEFEVVK